MKKSTEFSAGAMTRRSLLYCWQLETAIFGSVLVQFFELYVEQS